jgi:hypothetical protein
VVDTTAPTNPTLSWNTNPLLSSTDTILTASTDDAGSGIKEVTYTIDNGPPQQMTYDAASDTWQATFGSSLAVGTYAIVVRATDNAGNTNDGAVDVLAVYTTSNGYVTGHAKILPTTSDTLPIDLDTSNNPAKLVIGFTNLTAPTSGSFDVDYSVKNNQNEFALSSTGITWILISDSTHASILGEADLTTYVDGTKTVTSGVSVRFDITLGTNGADDQVTMSIYGTGVNPTSGTPSYVISDAVLPSGSHLMVHP